jgi:hypothetical protein
MLMRLHAGKNQQHGGVNGGNHGGDSHRKVNNQPFRFAMRFGLLLEEIHTIYDLRFTIYDWRPFALNEQTHQSSIINHKS